MSFDVTVQYPRSLMGPDVPRETELVTLLKPLLEFESGWNLNIERALARELRHSLGTAADDLPLIRFATRPGIEPILQQAWCSFCHPLTPEAGNALVDALVGRHTPPQTTQGHTLPARDGTRVLFAPPHTAALWWDRINGQEDKSRPLSSACFAYAQTVLSHPYQDGNGRLARAMYQRSLGRSGLLAGPLLPLGPLVYANHRVHDRALQHLGMTGDWDPFVGVMLGLTRKAAAFTHHVLSTQKASTSPG